MALTFLPHAITIPSMKMQRILKIILIFVVMGLVVNPAAHEIRQESIWQVISVRPILVSASVPIVQKRIASLKQNQEYITELTTRARPYIYYIYQQTRKRNMPVEVALLPMLESNYNAFDHSSVGANGLWQLMPETAKDFHVKRSHGYDGRYDVVASTQGALDYLTYLHKRFGDWLLAFAAYHCGEGAVTKAITYNLKRHKSIDFWSLPLPYETKLYVPTLLAMANVIKNPHIYNLKLAFVPNTPYFDTVKIKGPIRLAELAKLSHTQIKTLRNLNPAYRGVILQSKKKTAEVLVPIAQADMLRRHFRF